MTLSRIASLSASAYSPHYVKIISMDRFLPFRKHIYARKGNSLGHIPCDNGTINDQDGTETNSAEETFPAEWNYVLSMVESYCGYVI